MLAVISKGGPCHIILVVWRETELNVTDDLKDEPFFGVLLQCESSLSVGPSRSFSALCVPIWALKHVGRKTSRGSRDIWEE
jgi:hypothetical protein